MRLKADLALLFVTILWGGAFAVMREAAEHGSVFLLNGARFLLGGLLLLPFFRLGKAYNRANLPLVGMAGFALFAAAAFQQAGLQTTTAGNGGFITSLYVVLVPLLLLLFWRERPSVLIGVAAVLALGGGFLLSTAGHLQVQGGDVLVFIGAFFWALHVIIISKAQARIAPLPFAFGQYLICSLLNLAVGALFESPTWADVTAILPAILYTGIFSVAIGFTVQVYAQKYTPPSDAALILSMEAVFAALFGWWFLGERLLPIQIVGCSLIFVAVLLVQIRNGKIKIV